MRFFALENKNGGYEQGNIQNRYRKPAALLLYINSMELVRWLIRIKNYDKMDMLQYDGACKRK
jgi:hypothetical protein